MDGLMNDLVFDNGVLKHQTRPRSSGASMELKFKSNLAQKLI